MFALELYEEDVLDVSGFVTIIGRSPATGGWGDLSIRSLECA